MQSFPSTCRESTLGHPRPYTCGDIAPCGLSTLATQQYVDSHVHTQSHRDFSSGLPKVQKYLRCTASTGWKQTEVHRKVNPWQKQFRRKPFFHTPISPYASFPPGILFPPGGHTSSIQGENSTTPIINREFRSPRISSFRMALCQQLLSAISVTSRRQQTQYEDQRKRLQAMSQLLGCSPLGRMQRFGFERLVCGFRIRRESTNAL
jgi:hypothetical protein